MDNWKLYGNQYWPSIYLMDKKATPAIVGMAKGFRDTKGGNKINYDHEKIKLLMAEK